MSSLWKKATSPTIEDVTREILIKRQLTSELKRTIRALQQENIGKEEPIYGGEHVSNVCICLEAIFIHGIKDTLASKVSIVFGGNADKMPVPDFWPVVMVYSHKDVLDQICRLNQIITDIGRCRAWLRVALNDGLITSYIETMLQDRNTLQSYYKSTAYFRDAEQPDIMKTLLDGLSVFQFQLACNCGVLNSWTAPPLTLAGMWTPPAAPQPVMPAVDVVEYFCDEEIGKDSKGRGRISSKSAEGTPSSDRNVKPRSKLVDTDETVQDSPVSISSTSSEIIEDTTTNNQHLTLDDINKVLDSTLSVSHVQSECSVEVPSHENPPEQKSSPGSSELDFKTVTSDTLASPSSVPDFQFYENSGIDTPSSEGARGNRIASQYGWSSLFDQDEEDGPSCRESDIDSDSQSYDSLLLSYKRYSGRPLVGTPEITDFMTSVIKVPDTKTPEESESSPDSSTDNTAQILNYEIVPRSYAFTSKNADESTQRLLSIIGKICPEQGLDTQNYQCFNCLTSIGMIYGKARLCHYDGYNYCSECHENEEYFIPSYIIHNWDFRKYSIAKCTKSFLHEVEGEPLFDLKVLNPQIYTVVEAMAHLQVLRTQLGFLRSYIFTCRESVAEELRKKLWPREYLYEHIHLYSLSDLLQVPTGILAQTLHRTILFAKKHIQHCQLCMVKGFICEICSNPQVIYPFEMDSTYRCEKCLAVYHSICMDSNKPCPKCERRQKREAVSDSSWSLEDND